MSDLLLECRGERLLIQVTPNGKAHVTTTVYDGRSQALLLTDAIQLSRLSQRAAFCAHLPEADRFEAERLLADLAVKVSQLPPVSKPREAPPPPPPLEPWPDGVDGGQLLADLEATIRRYVVVAYAEVLALWLLHTYAFEAGEHTPYIWFSSPTRQCGKSVAETVLASLAAKARRADSMSAAAIRRVVDRDRPTVLLDELDHVLRGDGAENIRGVLNSGFARGGKFVVCDGDNNEPREFCTYCPKVLAGIGKLWDTVQSRSIHFPMRRASKDELRSITRIRGDRIQTAHESLRRRCLRWATDHLAELAEADPDVPDALDGRQADVWRPLLAIADLAGDPWPSRARAAAVTMSTGTEEEGDRGLMAVTDVIGVFRLQGEPFLASATVTDALLKQEERGWAEYGPRGLTPTGLARLLGRFGVKPALYRTEAGPMRGYHRAELEKVGETYLPAVLSETTVTSVTDPDVTPVTDDLEGTALERGDAWEPSE